MAYRVKWGEDIVHYRQVVILGRILTPLFSRPNCHVGLLLAGIAIGPVNVTVCFRLKHRNKNLMNLTVRTYISAE